MTLGSLALAAEPATTSTVVVDYSNLVGGTDQTGVANSDGVVFTLSNDATRFKLYDGTALTSTVALQSIEIAAGHNNLTDANRISNKTAIVTDSNGLVLGWSQSKSTVNRAHDTDWGTKKYTRDFTTFSNFLAADGVSKAITLSTEESYYVYFGTDAQIYALFEATLPTEFGGPATPVTMTSDYFTQVRVTTSGKFDETTAEQYGFISGAPAALNPNLKAYAPMMGVTVQNINVPEPTTGTLSLLALAGLCIRRRK